MASCEADMTTQPRGNTIDLVYTPGITPSAPIDLENYGLLTVFFFDENGRFHSKFEAVGDGSGFPETLDIELDGRAYTVMAIAGYDERSFNMTKCIEGYTHMNDIVLSIDTGGNNVAEQPVSMLYMADQKKIKIGKEGTTHMLELRRVTRDLYIEVKGLDQPDEISLRLSQWSNGYGPGDEERSVDQLIYIPSFTSMGENGIFEGMVTFLKPDGDGEIRFSVVRNDKESGWTQLRYFEEISIGQVAISDPAMENTDTYAYKLILEFDEYDNVKNVSTTSLTI